MKTRTLESSEVGVSESYSTHVDIFVSKGHVQGVSPL